MPWLGDVWDFFLPALCPTCERPGPGLCDNCRAVLPGLVDPCPHCASPGWDVQHSCQSCGGSGFAWVNSVHCNWAYADRIRDLVHLAKVNGDTAAITALCRLLPQDLPSADVVVPVPPAPGRRSGPHLATALAKALARNAGLPCRRDLRTTRLAAEQHRLGQQDRRRNVATLFAARSTASQGQVVLLVDDLLTSGASASAAARVLRQAGATKVHLVTLARTVLGQGPADAARAELEEAALLDLA